MRRIVHPKMIERGYAVDCGRVRLKMKLDFFSKRDGTGFGNEGHGRRSGRLMESMGFFVTLYVSLVVVEGAVVLGIWKKKKSKKKKWKENGVDV